jgi:class 3 adenylate cyclase/tetratricopeptide (TPR) repeat protein
MPEMSNSVLSDTDDAGHRLHVTLMFSDLCDYTALGELVDPEEVDDLRRQLDQLTEEVVRKHAGHVAQVYGDGHLCVFGYPQPREDDVRRGINTALELHAAVRAATWSRLPLGFELRLHTGIHSGLVFVRSGTERHGRFQLSGDTVNTAARLCGAAQRDQILVSAKAISGNEQFFEARAIAPIWLKGKRAPQATFLVVGRSGVRTRFEASTRRGLTRFVNRQVELGTLVESLRVARGSRGRLVVVSGGAGIGKTRLIEEFTSRAHAVGARVLYGTCENYGELVPLEPFSQVLHQAFGIAGHADQEAEARVARQCRSLGPEVAAQTATYLRLMGLRPAREDELASAAVVPALRSLIEQFAVEQPLTLILDDWQWADGASRAVLGRLRDIGLARGGCLLVAMRATDQVDPTLQPDEWVQLAPLAGHDCASVMAALRPDALSPAVTEVVLERAGGNPLFLEELCRALPTEWGSHQQLEGLEVPTTVQGVIQTRVAGLPLADRHLLGVASVIGIEFQATMLAELCGASATGVRDRLKVMCLEDLIYNGDAVDSYRFKHGLTREVVYESVLLAERKQHHGRVAAMLELASDASNLPYEALAYHYSRSGDHVRAAHHAERAGDRALAASALDRACHHYHAAMCALDALPATRDTRRQWLALCAKWGLPFVFSPVHASEQLQVLHTAGVYADEVGDFEAKARSWHWLGWAHYALANYAESIRYYQAALELAEQLEDRRLVAQLQTGLGQSQAASGDYVAGLENLARGLSSKRQQASAQSPRAGRVAQGYAYALACVALVHADRGDFALSDQVFEEALSSVSGIKHAIEGSILGVRCIALLWRGHWAQAVQTAQRARQNAQHVNSAFSFATCSFFGAYAEWEISGSPEQVRRMRDAADWISAQHLELYAAADYAWLAHALLTQGQHDLAREYTTRALQRAAQGDPLGAALAYRVLARMEPAEPDANAEAHVQQCLDLAMRAGEARGSRHEAVKTFLLRAQLSQASGAHREAREWAERSRAEALATGMPWHLEHAERLLASIPGV